MSNTNDTLPFQLSQQLRYRSLQAPCPATLLRRRHDLRRQGGGNGGDVASRNVLEPARVGHERVARCQGIQFHRLICTIPAIDRTATDRLGLIITRTDARESSDPVGEYTIVLHTSTTAP